MFMFMLMLMFRPHFKPFVGDKNYHWRSVLWEEDDLAYWLVCGQVMCKFMSIDTVECQLCAHDGQCVFVNVP